jgi:hypothetical protein
VCSCHGVPSRILSVLHHVMGGGHLFSLQMVHITPPPLHHWTTSVYFARTLCHFLGPDAEGVRASPQYISSMKLHAEQHLLVCHVCICRFLYPPPPHLMLEGEGGDEKHLLPNRGCPSSSHTAVQSTGNSVARSSPSCPAPGTD